MTMQHSTKENNSMSTQRTWVGLTGVALAALLLAGCGGNGSDDADSAKASASASDTAKKESRPKDDASSESPGEGTGDAPTEAELEEYAQTVEEQAQSMYGTLNGVYEEIRVEADYPDGISVVYVFAEEVPDGAAAKLDEQVPVLEATVKTNVAPELKGMGIEHPQVTYEFRNPDESVIWSKTFTDE